MVGFRYTVPLVGEDLAAGDTYLHLVDSLSVLADVCEDVFSRIDARVDSNLKTLAGLDTRIEKAQRTIDSIRGSSKALQVCTV